MKLSIVAVSLFSLSSSVYVDAQRRLQKSSKTMKSHGTSLEETVPPTMKETTAAPEPPPPPPPPPPPSPAVFRAVAPALNQYDMCTDFCKGAVSVCEGVVDWVTNTYATPYTRHLDGGAGTDATGQPEEQFGACHDSCMRWVYWRQDYYIEGLDRFIIGHNTGDSLNCRMNHLQFALSNNKEGVLSSESNKGQHHCMHLTPDGGWLCSGDRNADNKTAEQLYKEAMFTKHKVGDCWLAGDDKIADCHYKGLTDATVNQSLRWLPDDVEHIFLIANLLTKVPDLSRFTELKGINLKNNAIDTVTSNDFAANTKLQSLTLDGNFITEFPADFITANTDLTYFSALLNYVKGVPQTLFATNKELEQINLAFCYITGFESGTFDGLSKLKLVSFASQGAALGFSLTEDGIPDGLFDDLVNLEYLSIFQNKFSVIKEKWFGDWSSKVEAVSMFGQSVPLVVIEDGVFDKLPSLLELSTHQNGHAIDPSDLPNNPQLTVTVGDGKAILAPLPKPGLVNMELI